MNKDNSIYLDHILYSINKIFEYTKGMQESDFIANSMAQDAVIRQFEIIGEATKQVSKEFRLKFTEVPWNEMAGMRDKLIHNYIDVDLSVVWKTVQQDIPMLKEMIGRCK